MSENQQNKDEEVDLGSLFLIIGNGFKKFFNFIGRIFKGIFHFLILILLFLKENIIKLSIAVIIGAGVGVYFEVKKEDIYASDLLVKPNFNSTKQLYGNINYYNELVAQEQYKRLQSTFNIDSAEAYSIQRFEVTPIKTDNDILASYNSLIISIDTTAIESYSFEEFKKEFTEFDYKVHKVYVEATNNKVFAKLGDEIINSIVENKYYDRIRNTTKENLYRTDSLLRKELVQVDSLRQVYMKVMLEEAKKESSGTNIDMGNTTKISKELALFDTNKNINRDLRNVLNDISEKSEIINVISDFQGVGYKVEGLTNNKIVVFAGLAFLAMVGIILLFKLNVFLENYKRE